MPDIRDYILRRKKELNAIILAHYYQLPEIQDIADFVGDSLQLAVQAHQTDAETIVFCGVGFMAESAKILNPNKLVLLPDNRAGCPMADMITGEELRQKKKEYPDSAVVCYVNSSAEVKAESDICCTSSNALDVVNSIPEETPIIFVPDRNLGAYIQKVTGRPIICWEGCCPVHDILSKNEIEKQKAFHPEAEVVVHPECPPEVTAMADAVCSTAGILNYIKESNKTEFIVGTEEGFLHTLHKNCAGKSIYLARQDFTCKDMKYINLEKLAESMEKLQYQIQVPEPVREGAAKALNRMLALKP